FVASSPNDPEAPRAWLALARAREAAGDRAGALEAYSKAPRDDSAPGWTREAQFSHARLLAQDKRWDDARPILERLLKKSDGAAAAEAAYALGESYAGDADPLVAVEYYLSAAYLAPDSPQGRRGLLSAARAYAAAKQPDMATTAYKNLLAQTDLPADMRATARTARTALPRPPRGPATPVASSSPTPRPARPAGSRSPNRRLAGCSAAMASPRESCTIACPSASMRSIPRTPSCSPSAPSRTPR